MPTFSAASIQAKGRRAGWHRRAASGAPGLVELHNGGDTPSYVPGTENRYAITRYNWSIYYAMSVIKLGSEVAAARSTQ
ncbi:lytic murein transglycosylase [Acidovorax sp. sif1233]|uniref:lytic murein transglycosylase n=1 Tax=Acidovorax sp. sif1233 TaxID=2854792 RepID=UPI00351D2C9F